MQNTKGKDKSVYSSVVYPMIVTARQFVKSFVRPSTVVYPYEKLETMQGNNYFGVDALTEDHTTTIWNNYRGMHSLNVEDCISCSVCARTCPDNAIELVQDKSLSPDKKYPQVDYGRCCFCSLCVDSCPQQCLKMTPIYEIVSFDREGMVASPSTLYENHKKYGSIKKMRIERPVSDIQVKLVAPICTGCSICSKKCPEHAITMVEIKVSNPKIRRIWKEPVIDNEKCIRCGECIESCGPGALVWGDM